MKNLFKILTATLFIVVILNGCKKDDEVIPDVTGSTYELYKIESTLLGSTETTDVVSTDSEYYKWKFVTGGKVEDGDGIEVGTWVQNGEKLTVTEYGIATEWIVKGNDITYEIDLSILGIYKTYMRKI